MWIDPWRISCTCIYISESSCVRFGSKLWLPHLLVYFCCVIWDGIQWLQTHKGLHTHTHTHMFKVTLIGWGRLTWRSHNKGLSGVDWCVGHSFEMPYVALIKITNIKYTTHPTRHGITVFIVVMGEFLFPWFSLTIQPLNWTEMTLNEIMYFLTGT